TLTPGLSGGWTLGDGDFDGVITPADYLPIDSNIGSGVGNPLGGNHPVVTAIPEPGLVTLILVLMAAGVCNPWHLATMWRLQKRGCVT
ncbi:MAG: hypothetical protein SFX18_18775, partial [Pirellulales bacterium]|nr:hypothetical protein [Pirellulales bacterium]